MGAACGAGESVPRAVYVHVVVSVVCYFYRYRRSFLHVFVPPVPVRIVAAGAIVLQITQVWWLFV